MLARQGDCHCRSTTASKGVKKLYKEVWVAVLPSDHQLEFWQRYRQLIFMDSTMSCHVSAIVAAKSDWLIGFQD